MNRHNTSDLIETYLKKILEDNERVEIRRAEMATLFDCVPSQINYVINTRFTIQRGYMVESKRGGGGYIRIEKVKISDNHHYLEEINQLFEETISEKDAFSIIQKLHEERILSRREGNILLTILSKSTLCHATTEHETRASLLHAILERLSYEDRK